MDEVTLIAVTPEDAQKTNAYLEQLGYLLLSSDHKAAQECYRLAKLFTPESCE
jgi:hypothetical protein